MNSDTQQLAAIRSQTIAALASLQNDPRPTYSVNGQEVRWQEYADSLRRTVDWCDEKLVGTQPFEVRSGGRG